MLRIAHKLSETVLNPKTIEKVNVKLALSVFDESTIAALNHYGFSETAAVLKLFTKFWFILNVSTPSIGKHKRDIVRDPIRSPEDWKLEFRDVAAAPQTPQLGGAQANFGGPS